MSPCAVYATTASNPDESSYACYYDAKLETYLGDCYSVYWMENVDKVGPHVSMHYRAGLQLELMLPAALMY